MVVSKHVLFSPLVGEDSHFDSYFSTGLDQPPTINSLLEGLDCETFSKPALNHRFSMGFSSKEEDGVPRCSSQRERWDVIVRVGFQHISTDTIVDKGGLYIHYK